MVRNTSEHFKKIFNIKDFICHNFFWYFALFTFIINQVYSSTEIWLTHYPAIILCFATQFLLVALRLMYSYVSLSKVNPFRRTIVLTWSLIWFNTYHMYTYKTPFFDEVKLYYFCNTYQTLAVFHLIYYLITETKTILGISIFSLKKPYQVK